MLKACNSVCCCFSCTKESSETNTEDEFWAGKNKTSPINVSDKSDNNDLKNSKDDVKVICEANFEHILTDQTTTSVNLYRFVSSNESMSLSLPESIIEEEELDDAEACDSIVYMVDGQPSPRKDLDNNSGSEYSSDITIVNVNIDSSSLIHHVSSSISVTSNKDLLHVSLENNSDIHGNEDDGVLHDNPYVAQIGHKSCSIPVIETTCETAQKSDINNVKMEHNPDETFCANKSALCRGKFN